MHKLIILLILLTAISGCQNFASNSALESQESSSEIERRPNMHFYVERLTRQLLATANGIDINKSIAVGTILPSTLKTGNNLPKNEDFGVQIQESLLTLVTQAGLKAIEFKTMPYIQVGSQHDQMLSRDVKILNPQVKADYFLTGTYTAQEQGTIVNLRLIEVPSNSVIAAATDYLPSNVMWNETKVRMKNQQIYRSEY